jgi:prevent-host-death family protein
MKTVNIGTLKNKLSSYLQDVKNGEEVIVQDRKKPIARIVPIKSDDFTDEELYLASIGVMILPENPKGIDWEAFWAAPRPEVSDEAVKEAIDWVKGDH